MEKEHTMIKMIGSAFCCIALLPALFAVGGKGEADPVAGGYPAWTGISPKNYVTGRTLLSPCDLRQRVATIVVEFDAAKTTEQANMAGPVATLTDFIPSTEGRNWELITVPRDIIVVFVARNAKNLDDISKGLKFTDADVSTKLGLRDIAVGQSPVYANLTFDGAPDTAGKLPFVYMLGYEGKELLVQEKYDSKTTLKALRAAIAEQRKKLNAAELEWRPYYGYVAEPKYFKELDKALKSGMSLDRVTAKLKRGVVSPDAEKAKEAQMLYDALEQTRDELIYQARCEVRDSPHVAAYHIGEVLRFWPNMKKQLAEASEKLKANADAKPLIAIFPKLAQWSSPNFMCKNAGEAKKIVGELKKMKKTLEPVKENGKNITVQNGALMLDGMIDELISTIPSKVPQT